MHRRGEQAQRQQAQREAEAGVLYDEIQRQEMCDGMGIGAGRREQAQRLQAQREAEAEAGVLYDEIQRQVRCFMFDEALRPTWMFAPGVPGCVLKVEGACRHDVHGVK
jgi:hypothetical protein